MAVRWTRVIGGAVALALATPIAAAGALYWRLSNPAVEHPPLPPGLVALGTPEGDALAASATATADLAALKAAFQAQQKATWCGVASATIVLDALRDGPPLAQDAFFTDATAEVRSWSAITFSGMPLDDLGGLLEAHGVRAAVTHAGDSSVDGFRAEAARNLATPGDYVLVNYRRAELGQGETGHISPLAAYDEGSDRFLVLDVTAYKWPPVWVTAAALFAAMDTVDDDGGRTRGWVVVSER